MVIEKYEGVERRQYPISEEIIEIIAERAAEKAVEKMTEQAYATVGKFTMNKIFTVIGIAVMSLSIFLVSKGFIKL